MRVVICGAGLVGFAIARYLADSGNEVTVVDQRPELVRQIGESLDIRTCLGHASLPSTLEEAGAAHAEMLIAVTHADEVNMIACQVAHSLFGVPIKIARVRQQDYLDPRWSDLFRREHLPIDVVISPEVEVAHAIALRLEVPGALNVVPFADDRVRLVAVRLRPDTPILDTPLRQLTYLFPNLHLVCIGIVRGDQFFLPDADDTLLVGDEVFFVVETAQLAMALPAFGVDPGRSERVVIVGAGNIGLYLARELEARFPGMDLKLIEADRGRAETAARQLRRAAVLCGDARDLESLREANVGSAEALVAVTNQDEVNVMSGLLAKYLGCGRAMALYNNPNYGRILYPIGIDIGINPRETTVSSILRHVRRGRIKAVHTLRDGEAEVYEAEALEASPIIGRPLREQRFGRSILIGAIVRRDERGKETVLRPTGDTVVLPHDRVVLAARSDAVRRVEQLFAVRADVF
ncbi:Trk system potassium uptake protein TrkA [bacterium HR40]|nr:Trk system potassium uptake protein TrkA [bacterium HR40]